MPLQVEAGLAEVNEEGLNAAVEAAGGARDEAKACLEAAERSVEAATRELAGAAQGGRRDLAQVGCLVRKHSSPAVKVEKSIVMRVSVYIRVVDCLQSFVPGLHRAKQHHWQTHYHIGSLPQPPAALQPYERRPRAPLLINNILHPPAGAEAGDGRDESNKSLAERLEDARNAQTAADAEAKAADIRAKHLHKQLADARKSLASKEKEGGQLAKEMAKAQQGAGDARARLQVGPGL